MRLVGVLVAAGSAAGCVDVGPEPVGVSGWLAVGATGGAAFVDLCTEDQRGDIYDLHCTDETVVGVSGEIAAPFAITATTENIIAVTANGVGDATLDATVTEINGDTRDFPIPFHARAIDRMDVTPTCVITPIAGQPLVLATDTTFDIDWVASGDGNPLTTNGLPLPFTGDGLVIGAPGMLRQPITTPSAPGPARLVSADVPDFELAVDVVDRATLGIVLIPSTDSPSVNSVVELDVRASAPSGALCQVPDAGWTVDASPATVCDVRTNMFVVGQGPVIALNAVGAGTCLVTVADATAVVTDTIQLDVN